MPADYVLTNSETLHGKSMNASHAVMFSCRSKTDFAKPPDRKYIVYGLDNFDPVEVVATDRAVLFLSATQLSLFGFEDLQVVNPDDVFIAGNSFVSSVSFVPRSDDPLIAFYRRSSDPATGPAACTLVLHSGEGLDVGADLLVAQPTSGSGLGDADDRVFPAHALSACTADASCALMCDAASVWLRDISTSAVRSIPVGDDVTDKMAVVNGDVTTGNILLFAVSPKDPLVGVVYRQSADTIHLFDAKATATSKPAVQLKNDANSGPVTDFSFIPATGNVISYHRKSDETLTVWNQRSGASVSRETVVDVCYIRLSPASDRMALSMCGGVITGSGSAALILRSGDNHFSVSLSLPVTWSPEPTSSDVEFSGDGTVLVGFCAESSGCLWNAGSGESLRTLDGPRCSPEVVGWPTNVHAILHDPSNERLLVVDVISGCVVTAAATDGRVNRKHSSRRFRISPRGGAVVGSTNQGELRAFLCRNMASVRRQSSLQAVRSSTSPVTSPK